MRDAFPYSFPSDEVEELLTGYVLNSLSRQERNQVEQLLEASPELQHNLQQMEAVVGLMGQGTGSAQAPVALRSRILQAACQPEVQRVPTLSPRSQRNKWTLIAAALACGLALVLGIENYQLRQQVADLQEIHVQQFALKGTPVATTAIGHVLIDMGRSKAVLSFQNLPTPPQGRFYQLWAVTSGKTVPCGKVQPAIDGHLFGQISVPIHEYSGQPSRLLLTQESDPRPLHPSSAVVMESLS